MERNDDTRKLKQEAQQLPLGWGSAIDAATGGVYYFHQQTNTFSREHPVAAGHIPRFTNAGLRSEPVTVPASARATPSAPATPANPPILPPHSDLSTTQVAVPIYNSAEHRKSVC